VYISRLVTITFFASVVEAKKSLVQGSRVVRDVSHSWLHMDGVEKLGRFIDNAFSESASHKECLS
jgi:hypothetical protein